MTTRIVLLDGILKLSVSLWPAHATNMKSSTTWTMAAGGDVEPDAGHRLARVRPPPSAGSAR